MTDSTINLQSLQKFSRVPSLVSAAHCQELMMLASSPERNAAATRDTEQFCASLYGSDENASGKPFVFSGGIALIPVYGALLHRDPWCCRWATGYDYIASRFGAALGDPDVKGIVWDINSYGGHVAGNFELCDMIYEARGKKPMAAIVDNRALSGGYSIASAIGKAYVTPSAELGSIGVVMLHMSYEKMLAEAGVKPTFVFAGKHKVDGNPYEDLPDDVREAFQASIERSYDSFVSLVARNRGIEVDAVRATEARCYDAQEAVSLGLVDAVMPPRAAYAAFLSEVSKASGQTTSGVKKMSEDTAIKNAAGGDGDEAARLDAARKEGAKQAQARVASILSCEEAKKRPKLANHIALNMSMSAEDAKGLLSASAEETAPEKAAVVPPAPGSGALAAAMAADEGKVAGSGGSGSQEGDAKPNRAARIAENHKLACGRK